MSSNRNLAYNSKLEIVRLAYEKHACLDFRVKVNRAEALRAARIIGAYNAFNPYTLFHFLRALPPKTRLEIGRDLSPVLYVYAQRGFFESGEKAAIKRAAESANLQHDEFDLADSHIHVRIWWD